MRPAIAAVTAEAEARPARATLPASFSSCGSMPRIGAFRRRHPNVGLLFSLVSEVIGLERGTFGLAIRFWQGDERGRSGEPLVISSNVLAGMPGLLRARVASFVAWRRRAAGNTARPG
ncbi:MAG: hypothetical protein AAF677_03640 [Pseudomonadota bacterium]